MKEIKFDKKSLRCDKNNEYEYGYENEKKDYLYSKYLSLLPISRNNSEKGIYQR
ncbi:unnamed protein product [marine sediment metagenome]|uniref:Uncharacterized protein n=1 Tax=marine sediment metagenome TaxID=412755 RepID=X1EUQ5_9ZZZZ